MMRFKCPSSNSSIKKLESKKCQHKLQKSLHPPLQAVTINTNRDLFVKQDKLDNTKNLTARKVLSLFDSPRRAILHRTRAGFNKKDHSHPYPLLQDHPNLHQNLSTDTISGFSEPTTELLANEDVNEHCVDMDIDDMNKENTNDSVEQNCLLSCTYSILSWLQNEAPFDVIPKILSYAGPRKIDALSRVNKSWRETCLDEAVWKTLCEDTYKWIPRKNLSRDSYSESTTKNRYMPQSSKGKWRQYYCDNPIIPIDYSSLESALNFTGSKPSEEDGTSCKIFHERNIRILLYPGRYTITAQIMFHVLGDKMVSIETLNIPQSSTELVPPWEGDHYISSSMLSEASSEDVSDRSIRRRIGGSSIRNIFSCRSFAENLSEIEVYSKSSTVESCYRRIRNKSPFQRATIVLRSKNPAESIICVRQGTVRLSKIDLIHHCSGTDIWNGNAAMQIQPYLDKYGEAISPGHPNLPPTAIVEYSSLTSGSGRGIVAIDGGRIKIRNCYIHNCAATGIYVGGPGSFATIKNTDIVKNGRGNSLNNGIVRGHSGFYLEQGKATLNNCNISQNYLTGISAISPENAVLTVENSDLKGNRSLQLEMPPSGSESCANSTSERNVIMSTGTGRLRSGLIPTVLKSTKSTVLITTRERLHTDARISFVVVPNYVVSNEEVL